MLVFSTICKKDPQLFGSSYCQVRLFEAAFSFQQLSSYFGHQHDAPSLITLLLLTVCESYMTRCQKNYNNECEQ